MKISYITATPTPISASTSVITMMLDCQTGLVLGSDEEGKSVLYNLLTPYCVLDSALNVFYALSHVIYTVAL